MKLTDEGNALLVPYSKCRVTKIHFENKVSEQEVIMRTVMISMK